MRHLRYVRVGMVLGAMCICAVVRGAKPIDPAPHLVLSTGLLASAGLLALAKTSTLGGLPGCALNANGYCDVRGLTSLDRWSLGAQSRGWQTWSNVGEAVGIAAPAAVLLSLAAFTPWEVAGWDLLIWVETMAVCAALDQGLKLAMRRPRPVWYTRVAHGSEAQVSFPSGHAFAASTGTTALTTLFWQRYPDSPWRWVVLAAGAVVSGITGVGRVQGGQHFTSDVLAGWALGVTVGIIQPTLASGNWAVNAERVVSPTGEAMTTFRLRAAF